MKKSLKIYLVRHGQTTYNRDRRFTGFHDPSLTKLGVKQARLLAKKLKGKKFQLAFHTSLHRSKQTLKELLKFHPECTRIQEDDRMIERNYGLLNGTTHTQFIKKHGLQAFNALHRGFYTLPPRGESFAMVERRVRAFIIDLVKRMKKEQISVAISAHGNSIRLFRKIMEKASIKETCSWKIPYDNYFEYRIMR